MFRIENAGKSIKDLARALGMILFFGLLISGVLMFILGLGNEAPVVSIVGVIFAGFAYPFAYLTILFAYGIGDLIENTNRLRKKFCSDEDEN